MTPMPELRHAALPASDLPDVLSDTASARPGPSATAPSATAPPVDTAARAGWQTPVELIALGAIWGASFMFQRIAAKDFGVVPLAEMRVGFGALILLPFLWRERARFPARLWPKLAILGMINSAVPFMLFAWAAQRAPAGIGAITNAMAVLFTALVAFLFFGEKIGMRRAFALFVGFAGVVVLASGKAEGASVGLAAAAGTFAAFLYGISTNLVKRQLVGLPPAAVATATLGCAALLCLPLAIVTWPETPIPTRSWLSGITLGVLCTGIAYAIYFRLIQRIGAPRAVMVTYLVPLFGVAWAWALIDEPLTWTMAIACALILGSVALSQRPSA